MKRASTKAETSEADNGIKTAGSLNLRSAVYKKDKGV